jgi:hypothetical protein
MSRGHSNYTSTLPHYSLPSFSFHRYFSLSLPLQSLLSFSLFCKHHSASYVPFDDTGRFLWTWNCWYSTDNPVCSPSRHSITLSPTYAPFLSLSLPFFPFLDSFSDFLFSLQLIDDAVGYLNVDGTRTFPLPLPLPLSLPFLTFLLVFLLCNDSHSSSYLP